MLSIVTLPSPNDVISSVGSWSSPFFNEFSSFIGIAVGVVVGSLLLVWIIHIFKSGFNSLFSGRSNDIADQWDKKK